MKLIDILNMISKGELKEGTRVKYDNETYEYDGEYYLLREGDFCLLEDIYLNNLNDECEIIEPQMATEKIEELDVLGIGENQNIDNLGLASSMCDLRNSIRETQRKLNEVIRRINNERL